MPCTVVPSAASVYPQNLTFPLLNVTLKAFGPLQVRYAFSLKDSLVPCLLCSKLAFEEYVASKREDPPSLGTPCHALTLRWNGELGAVR